MPRKYDNRLKLLASTGKGQICTELKIMLKTLTAEEGLSLRCQERHEQPSPPCAGGLLLFVLIGKTAARYSHTIWNFVKFDSTKEYLRMKCLYG